MRTRRWVAQDTVLPEYVLDWGKGDLADEALHPAVPLIFPDRGSAKAHVQRCAERQAAEGWALGVHPAQEGEDGGPPMDPAYGVFPVGPAPGPRAGPPPCALGWRDSAGSSVVEFDYGPGGARWVLQAEGDPA